MKNRLLTALLMLALSATALQAQSMEEKYQEKLKKDFVSKIDWTKSLETAKKQAGDQKKLIFAYFTRSYAP